LIAVMTTPIIINVAHIGVGAGASIRRVIGAGVFVNTHRFTVSVTVLPGLKLIVAACCRAVTVLIGGIAWMTAAILIDLSHVAVGAGAVYGCIAGTGILVLTDGIAGAVAVLPGLCFIIAAHCRTVAVQIGSIPPMTAAITINPPHVGMGTGTTIRGIVRAGIVIYTGGLAISVAVLARFFLPIAAYR